MNVLMVSKSHYLSDVRVRREAEALADAGYQVTVISVDDGVLSSHGVAIIGVGEVPGLVRGGGGRGGIARQGARWLLLPEHRARAQSRFQARVLVTAEHLTSPPDVVHAHDFPALDPAASIARANSALLVYDAHEWWSGMARYGRPDPIRRRSDSSTEHRLAREADAVITVSDDAAKVFRDQYGIGDVTVVRNTFPARHDVAVTITPSGAVYAGRIGPGRDLQTVFESPVWAQDNRELHIMGPRDPGIVLPEFARVHESGSMDEVDRLLGEVGVALVTLTRGPLNHEIALPNKLFQAVSLGVPVVAANLPQLAKVVTEYNIGAVYEPGNVDSLTAAIDTVFADFAAFSAASVAAQAELDWAIDASRLRDVYAGLGAPA